MPRLIEPIDAIARAKKRDVFYIQFHPLDYYDVMTGGKYDYLADLKRKQVLDWLDENKIPWLECGPMAEQGEWLFCGYVGDIYLDVPYDESDPRYCKLSDYLENSDGSMKDANVRWYCLSLRLAMEYAHHDILRYWNQVFSEEAEPS